MTLKEFYYKEKLCCYHEETKLHYCECHGNSNLLEFEKEIIKQEREQQEKKYDTPAFNFIKEKLKETKPTEQSTKPTFGIQYCETCGKKPLLHFTGSSKTYYRKDAKTGKIINRPAGFCSLICMDSFTIRNKLTSRRID